MIALAPHTPAPAATPPACQTAQLIPTLGSAQGAAGTDFVKLAFFNLGPACTLRGYPGISAVDAAGHQLGRSATRSSGSKQKTVTLGAVGTTHASAAYTYVGFVDTGNFGSSCHEQLAGGIRVFPPDQKASRIVPYVFDACASGSDRFLTVQAVR